MPFMDATSFSWVKIKLLTKNQLPGLPGSALEVSEEWVVQPITLLLQLELSLSWALKILN